MPDYEISIPGYSKPGVHKSESILTPAQEVEVLRSLEAEYGPGVQILKRPAKPDTPIRSVAESLAALHRSADPLLSTPELDRAYEQYIAQPSTKMLGHLISGPPAYPVMGTPTEGLPGEPSRGERIAKWVIPQTPIEAIKFAALPLGGRLGQVVLKGAPRLGAFLGLMGTGAGLGAGEAAVKGENVAEGAQWGGLSGALAGAAGSLPGVLRRQGPRGPLLTGRAMAPEIGKIMESTVPELQGMQTPQQMYAWGRESPGHAAHIKEKIETMYGDMIDRISQGSGDQKFLIPSLLKGKDLDVVQLALQAQALAPAGPQSQALAAQNLQSLRDRFGVTLKEVAENLKALKAAFRSSSQTMATQTKRASVSQVISDVDNEIAAQGLPTTLMKDYAYTSEKYRIGKAFFDLFNPSSLYSHKGELIPGELQRRFANLSAEEFQPLAQRLGPELHTRLSNAIRRGQPLGEDVYGFLPSVLHAVVGTRGGTPMIYSSFAGKRPWSTYTAAPGRLPLESSQLWKDLMAGLSQRPLSFNPESPEKPR